MTTRYSLIAALFAAAVAATATAGTLEAGGGRSWYKGNTHAHTLWSDGDGAPEIVVDWYRDHGYHFLSLSDHNIYLDIERYFPIQPNSRLTEERVEEIRARFGDDWVEVDAEGGRAKMRLKTLSQLKGHFDMAGEFLLIPGEEVTSRIVHVNAINSREVIEPARREPGKTIRQLLQENFDAIEAQEKRLGVPILAHLNHPNFQQGVSAEDIIAVGGERFFEVYNGHAAVWNHGNEKDFKQSTDRIWDIVLSMRIRDGADRPIYGLATDDSHNYFEIRVGRSNVGRGWVMVLAEDLAPDAIVRAMKRGDFYASSGVTLSSISNDGNRLQIRINADPGVAYTTQFIGTMKGFDATSKPILDAAGDPVPWATRVYSGEVGSVLAETMANPATYRFTGNELYVRAKIVSSKIQENPHANGDLETAWTQPAIVP